MGLRGFDHYRGVVRRRKPICLAALAAISGLAACLEELLHESNRVNDRSHP